MSKKDSEILLRKTQLSIAIDSMSAEEFIHLLKQLDEQSLNKILSLLSDKGKQMVMDDMREEDKGGNKFKQELLLEVPGKKVVIKADSDIKSVMTDGTPGYKGVERGRDSGSE